MEESRGALLFQKVCHILNIILKVAVMVIIAFPFYWMVSTSLKDYTEALQFPPTLFPSSLHWENYAHVFEIVPIGLYFRNSVVVSLCVLVLQYLIIVPAAYSFARHEYFGKNIFFGKLSCLIFSKSFPKRKSYRVIRYLCTHNQSQINRHHDTDSC